MLSEWPTIYQKLNQLQKESQVVAIHVFIKITWSVTALFFYIYSSIKQCSEDMVL